MENGLYRKLSDKTHIPTAHHKENATRTRNILKRETSKEIYNNNDDIIDDPDNN